MALFVLASCTPFALSPPARSLPLESSATLRPGTVAVQAGGGGTTLTVNAATVRARGRVGVVPTLELQTEGGYDWIDYGDERSRHLGAGRAGLKWAPVPWFALVAGVGGHAHGPFVATDFGLVFTWEIGSPCRGSRRAEWSRRRSSPSGLPPPPARRIDE